MDKNYHVILKHKRDKKFKDYITKEPVDKQVAEFIREVMKDQISDNCYIEFESIS